VGVNSLSLVLCILFYFLDGLARGNLARSGDELMTVTPRPAPGWPSPSLLDHHACKNHQTTSTLPHHVQRVFQTQMEIEISSSADSQALIEFDECPEIDDDLYSDLEIEGDATNAIMEADIVDSDSQQSSQGNIADTEADAEADEADAETDEALAEIDDDDLDIVGSVQPSGLVGVMEQTEEYPSESDVPRFVSAKQIQSIHRLSQSQEKDGVESLTMQFHQQSL